MNAWAEYPHESAHKLFTDNRDLSFAQSEKTQNGIVAPFPRSQPRPLPNPSPAGLPSDLR